MHYINKITEIPCQRNITLPMYKDITIVVEFVLDGGGADSGFDVEIDGGDSTTDPMRTIDGGDSFVTGGTSFGASHVFEIEHRATKKAYQLPCEVVEKDDMYLTLGLTFAEIPNVGQYTCRLYEVQTGEVLYMGQLEVRASIIPLAQAQNNTEIIQA